MKAYAGKAFVFALGALLAFGGLAPAQASLIHDLTVTEVFGFSGSGRIAFSSLSGNSASGVTAFDFSGRFVGSASGNPVDETFVFNAPTQIQNISWLIDPATWVLTLNLGTNLVTGSAGPAQFCALLQNNNAGGSCGGIFTTTNRFSRAIRSQIGSTSTSGGNLSTTAVQQQVPEPATIALFGLGLVGLGLAARLRRRPWSGPKPG